MPGPAFRYPSLLNYAFYQAGWFACVLGAAHHRPLTGFIIAAALLGAHLALSNHRRRDGGRVVIAVIVGAAFEALQLWAGTYRFSSGVILAALPPPWLLAMWAQMATTFDFSLRPIVTRPAASALFGAVGGPLAFLAGDRLGAVTLQRPLAPGLLLISVSWIAAMLIFCTIERRHGINHPDPARAISRTPSRGQALQTRPRP